VTVSSEEEENDCIVETVWDNIFICKFVAACCGGFSRVRGAMDIVRGVHIREAWFLVVAVKDVISGGIRATNAMEKHLYILMLMDLWTVDKRKAVHCVMRRWEIKHCCIYDIRSARAGLMLEVGSLSCRTS
jgi:hypothetical protein